MKKQLTLLAFTFVVTATKLFSQTYLPVNVIGYNQDGIAESIPSISSTSMAIDGSNHVLYSEAYALASSSLGGLSLAGTYTATGKTYQLAAYNQANVLKVDNAMKDSLILTTPKACAAISLLCFATDGDADTEITLRFSDGTSTTYTATMNDWYSALPSVLEGFGRTDITTDVIDYAPTDPKLYDLDLTLSCADASKLLTKVVVANTTAGTSACVFALSAFDGTSYTVTTMPVSCNGMSNGSADVTATGSSSPYTYSWNSTPTQTTSTASNLVAGNYTCTITDVNTCITTQTITITEPAVLNLSAINAGTIACFGTSTSASVSATGGTQPYSFSWNSVPAQNTATASLMANNYTCTLTDANNCTTTQTIGITEPTALVVSSVNSTSLACSNSSNAVASLTVTGGTAPYGYSWNSTPTQTSSTASNLTSGNYSCSITDANNCTTTQTVVINAPAVLAVSAVSSTSLACGTASNAIASLTVTGGTTPYTYSWNSTPTQTSSTASNLKAVSYTCTITDANACSISQSVTIASPKALFATSVVSCGQLDNGSATVTSITGGTAPYTYTWTSVPTQSTTTAVNLKAGTYNCTIKDALGCVISQTAVVITGPTAVINTTSLTCNGTATVASVLGATAPYTYYWNSVPAQTTSTATLTAGNYTCTIKDVNNCIISQTVNITQSTPIITAVASGTAPLCNGLNTGKVSITSTAGGTAPYTYSWNTTPVQTVLTVTALPAGIYECTITDAIGCSAKKVASAYVAPQNMTIYANPSTTVCANTTVTLSTNTPATYTWTNGAHGNTVIVTPTITTSYSFTGVANNGCNIIGDITVPTKTVGCVIGVEELENSDDIVLYPNPNNGLVTIKLLNQYNNASIEVFDALGKLVIKQDLISNETLVNTSKLENGVYFYIIKNNNTMLLRSKMLKN